MTVSESVKAKVLKMKKGHPFSTQRFRVLGSENAVHKAFSRLANEGVIVRVSQGIYARPKPLMSIPSIIITTTARQLAKTWAVQGKYKLVAQPEEAAYRLGLQTQAPMKTIMWTNGPSKEFKIGNELVTTKKTSPQKLRWANKPVGTLYRGLLAIEHESVTLGRIKTATKRLGLSGQEAVDVLHKITTQAKLPEELLHKLESYVDRLN